MSIDASSVSTQNTYGHGHARITRSFELTTKRAKIIYTKSFGKNAIFMFRTRNTSRPGVEHEIPNTRYT